MRVVALFATRASRMQTIHRWNKRYERLHTDQAGQLGQLQDASMKRPLLCGEDFFVPEQSEGQRRPIMKVPAGCCCESRARRA